MYILYRTLFVLFLCTHTFIFSMFSERFFAFYKRSKKVAPKVEYIKSIRFKYGKPKIIEKNESYFEIVCRKKLEGIIVQEVEREKIFGNKFVPEKPLEILKTIKFSSEIKKIIETHGQEFEWEFNFFYRKYKSVRGAWDLFIANVIAMEDVYEK